MAKYRKVDTRIWNDEKFRRLSHMGKLVFLMLLTHPNMTPIGAMRGSIGGMADELGVETEAFREAFQEAFREGMLEYDSKACFLALPNFLKYNSPESPNVVRSWDSYLDYLPECELKSLSIQRAKDFIEGLGEGFRKGLPKAFLKPSPNPRT